MLRNIFRLVFFLEFIFCLFIPQSVHAQNDGQTALVMTATGALTPAMEQYLQRAIRSAENNGDDLIVFQLNTPGGEIELMNRMVQLIRSSSVPIVVYVSPRGGMAASAGSILTLAGHFSAMAPETIIGAASPVGAQGEDIGKTMESKAKQALMATVRSITEGRRPPEAVKLAEAMIEDARAVSASEALQIKLVDFIATDAADLLKQLDGRIAQTVNGPVTLNTSGMSLQVFPTTLIEQLLQMLTNPNIVFLLLSVGVQAILIELSSPGGWIAGFIGVTCLALAVYGLGILPVNWFGTIFILIAIVLFILDISAPTHGALTAAGAGSFILGGLILFNSPNVPAFQRVSVPLVVITGIFLAVIFLVVIGVALRAQRTPIKIGQESLVGRVGVVMEPLNPSGSVQVGGELWSAESASGEFLPQGHRIQVIKLRGLTLIVHPQPEKEKNTT